MLAEISASLLPARSEPVSSSRLAVSMSASFALLFVAAVTIPNMTAFSMWTDEVRIVNGTLMLSSLRALFNADYGGGHPPLYFLLLRGWILLLGETDFALHSPSVLVTVIASAFVFRAAADLSGELFGGLAALLVFGGMGFVRYFSHEVHNYTLFLMLSAALLFFYHRWWAHRPGRRYAAGVIVATLALLGTHYFSLFPVLALNLHAAFNMVKRKRDAANWFFLQAIVAILYIPILPIVIRLATSDISFGSAGAAASSRSVPTSWAGSVHW